MTIDVLKAMSVKQPHAAERGGRPIDSAPFAGMLDQQKDSAQQVAPSRKGQRQPLDEARAVPDGRDCAEMRDRSEARQAEAVPAPEEGRTPTAPRADRGGKAPVQQSPAQQSSSQQSSTQQASQTADAEAPEGTDAVPGDGMAPGNTNPQSGAAQAATVTPATILLPETPVESDAATAQLPQPEPTVAPATLLPTALPLPVAATALAQTALVGVEQGVSSGTPAVLPADSSGTSAAGAPAPTGGPGPVTPDGQDFLLPASKGDDAVTVRASAAPATPLSLATGPVISPETAVVAMSAVDAPATAETADAAPRHGDEAPADVAEATVPAKAAAPAATAAGATAINANAKNTAPESAAAAEAKGSANAPAAGAAAPLAGALSGQALRLGEQPVASPPAASTNATAHPRFAIPTQPPASQVAAKLAAQAGDGGRSYDIQLDPENLGRVRVHLDVGKDGAVTASISADRADTLAMLRSDARTLQQALQDAGLSTSSGSLDFSLSGQRRDGGTWGSGYAGTRQAQPDDSPGDLRQADTASASTVAAGRPGRGSRAVDLKV